MPYRTRRLVYLETTIPDLISSLKERVRNCKDDDVEQIDRLSTVCNGYCNSYYLYPDNVFKEILKDEELIELLIDKKIIYKIIIRPPRFTIDNLVRYNNLPLIKYFFSRKFFNGFTNVAIDLTASLGFEHLLEYLLQSIKEHGLIIEPTDYARNMAQLKQHSSILEILDKYEKEK